ncbi:LysE family transporter [Micromonospora peucetia]|uniref:LysE family transporter n=1 Tax=Micromonospora peucetia TaxID=47871 RepID=UPI002251E8BE|nr:LysE family transporter [Micromonospora peucetia]MCX4385769.1 LysE family transporter [Micromonospora peucetia]
MILDISLASDVSGALAAFSVGAVAGLGVAVPLGAVGVLLLHEGMARGWRPALAGATGVAVVDLVYAAVAVIAGGAVTAVLSEHQGAVRVGGAVVLGVLALRGLVRAVRSRSAAHVLAPGGAPGGAFCKFVALTALNPLTAVYFTVLAAGLGDRLRGLWTAAAFALGVFAGSWAWQAVLAVIGSVAGARLPAGARAVTSIAGYGVVLVLAITLAVSA